MDPNPIVRLPDPGDKMPVYRPRLDLRDWSRHSIKELPRTIFDKM